MLLEPTSSHFFLFIHFFLLFSMLRINLYLFLPLAFSRPSKLRFFTRPPACKHVYCKLRFASVRSLSPLFQYFPSLVKSYYLRTFPASAIAGKKEKKYTGPMWGKKIWGKKFNSERVRFFDGLISFGESEKINLYSQSLSLSPSPSKNPFIWSNIYAELWIY